MDQETKRQEIIRQIQRLAAENGGQAPGMNKFQGATGIKKHHWLGKFWRGWSDALVEAGFPPNEWQTAYSDQEILEKIRHLAIRLGRFPKSVDLTFESNIRSDFPAKTILRRWSMSELAQAVFEFGKDAGDPELSALAQQYLTSNEKPAKELLDTIAAEASGYVYLIRYGADHKIGHTKSLNKRARQVQIELPAETGLIHSILTDDPVGIEAYWHKRFAERRTRGEWFKLSKSDIAAFKRWTKIW